MKGITLVSVKRMCKNVNTVIEENPMNENMSLEELKQQVAAIQQRIEEIEKKASHKGEKQMPWELAEVNEPAYYFDVVLSGDVLDGYREASYDLNAFKEESVAKGFANAFSVMIQLRQCEGAGERVADGQGWKLSSDGIVDCWWGNNNFSLFPPFPTQDDALAAAESVGIDRIIAAYKFLASGE